MFLRKIILVNFKNYSEAALEFSPRLNCFVGNNGEGKTNLLDAIYYLSFCKSFINHTDSQNIMHDAPFFVIQGEMEEDDFEGLNPPKTVLYCAVKRGENKQFKRNQKDYPRLADHIGRYPAVIISPFDSYYITEGSEERRKFIDSVISQTDKPYLDALISYNKILLQRNAMLKRWAETRTFDVDAISVWDEQLIHFGNGIHQKRKKFIKEIQPLFNHYYQWIGGEKEVAALEYQSQLNEKSFDDLLKDNRQKDRIVQYTSNGIHKDDILFKLNDFAVKKYASQGQQKSFLIALKLAQFQFIKNYKKTPPMLLLDDIFDKLDQLRVEKLMGLVSGKEFGQVFITDTHKSRIFNIVNKLRAEYKMFEISQKEILETNEA